MVQNRFFPSIGGAEKHVYLLSKYLIKHGHGVTVYTSTSLSKDDVLSLSLRPPFIINPIQKEKPFYEEVLEKINIKRFDMKLKFWSFNWIPDMSKELKTNISDYDIVHVHGYHISSSLVGCYYAKKNNKPLILTAHDLIIPMDLPMDAKLLKFLYDKTFGKILIKNASKLIALTEDNVKQYDERGADLSKISLVPNAVELDKYENIRIDEGILAKYGISDDDDILLFVGRIDKYKGIQDILEILPNILLIRPNIRLIVVGSDYGYRDHLELLAKDLNIADRIIFTGIIPDDELTQIYKLSDLFVFPSKMEGFGIVLLEAMINKTLCIAYPIPSVRKVIKNNENGILVADKKELMNKILYYLENDEERRDLEDKAFKYVKIYDIRNVVEQLEKIYMEASGCVFV